MKFFINPENNTYVKINNNPRVCGTRILILFNGTAGFTTTRTSFPFVIHPFRTDNVFFKKWCPKNNTQEEYVETEVKMLIYRDVFFLFKEYERNHGITHAEQCV